MQDTTPLQDQFPINPDIKTIKLQPGYPAFVIHNAHAQATIALHGAHLIDFVPHGEEPVIFMSKAAIFREGKAIRGGIPICWPWFNAHPTDNSLPSHGYARTSFWTLESSHSDASGTRLTFTLPSRERSQLSAILKFHIGKTLSLSLTTSNEGTDDVTYSEALHSYFCVSDSRQAHLTGLDQLEYIDTVGEETRKTQSGDLTFPGEVDRIYDHATDATLEDLITQRKIAISKTGSHSTIAWNPGIQKGTAISDLADDEIHQFICVEAGNAREKSITLKAGESHTIQCQISTASDGIS